MFSFNWVNIQDLLQGCTPSTQLGDTGIDETHAPAQICEVRLADICQGYRLFSRGRLGGELATAYPVAQFHLYHTRIILLTLTVSLRAAQMKTATWGNI